MIWYFLAGMIAGGVGILLLLGWAFGRSAVEHDKRSAKHPEHMD